MGSSPLMHPDAGTAAVVERLLSARAGRPVGVLRGQSLGGAFAPVARMTLDTCVGDPADPADPADPVGDSTVVVKTRRRGGTGKGYELANLWNEHASLRFLDDVGADVAPRLLATDDAAGVLIMTDVGAGGAGPTVEELVHARDAGAAPAARAALVGFARTVGAMHAATRGRGDAYYALRAALGPLTRRVSGSGTSRPSGGASCAPRRRRWASQAPSAPRGTSRRWRPSSRTRVRCSHSRTRT